MLKLFRSTPKLVTNNLARSIATSQPINRGALRRIDDPLWGMSSNLMRGLEQEFDYLRNQINKRFNNLENDFWEDDTFVTSPNPLRLLSPLQTTLLPMLPDVVSVDKDGNRTFNLSINVKEFKPEEVNVKTVGKNVVVSAKTERKDDKNYYLREFSQSYSLPEDLKVEDLQSKVTDQGMLVISAPLPKLPEAKEKPIQIKHE